MLSGAHRNNVRTQDTQVYPTTSTGVARTLYPLRSAAEKGSDTSTVLCSQKDAPVWRVRRAETGLSGASGFYLGSRDLLSIQ